MKIHKTNIEKYNGTLKELARDITDLRYESLSYLLEEISYNLDRDADKDREKGREQVALLLESISVLVSSGACDADKLWNICKKHMDYKEEV